MAVLEVSHITKRYGDYVAVDDVSFQVESGHIYGMLGPNGAGKTTTIRMIMNILAPDEGHIALFGSTMSDELKAKIGYLPEERGLYPKMNVTDMLVFLGELHGMKAADARQKANEWMQRLKIAEKAGNKVEELSKGMQQKLQIIGTILHNPDLIILDEPFSGLDPVNVNLIKNLMIELKESGKSIMLSTHMMDAAEKLCDEVLMINKGVKVLDGNLNDVLSEYGKNKVHIEFSGNGRVLENMDAVKRADIYANYAELELNDGQKPAQLLKDAVQQLEVHGLRSHRSSLNDIFIAHAGEEAEHA